MSEHAVLIPTSLGPVGGVVSEPIGEPRAAIVLLQGAGRPARSGVNSFWTRTARDLAERGVVALRFDYAAEGESIQVGEGEYSAVKSRVESSRGRAELDLHVLGEIMPWLKERLGGIDPFLAGACQGARMAIEFAGQEDVAPVPTFLIAPYLRKPFGNNAPIDPLVVNCLRASLERSPSWLLMGEEEKPEVSLLLERLGSSARGLELEIAPVAAVHLLDQPDIQKEARHRLLARIAREPTLGYANLTQKSLI